MLSIYCKIYSCRYVAISCRILYILIRNNVLTHKTFKNSITEAMFLFIVSIYAYDINYIAY